MKIKRINTAILLFALAGIVLTGCSNENIVNVNPQEEGTGNVSFSIVEKDYEPADNTPKSRVAIEETKPEIQDLGDGLMAEVSLVPDTTHRAEAPKTRAISTPTHYTIQAFQGGVKKGELKGMFNGSTFTPDASQPKSISLPHGTYDFVCFNDGVTANGTQLTVNRSAAATARFTVKRGVVINQDPKQQVEFTLKHAGAFVGLTTYYMNFMLQGTITNIQTVNEWGETIYKCEFDNLAEKYKYKLNTDANVIPESMVYDIATDAVTYPQKGQVSKSGEASLGGMPVSFSTPGGAFYSSSCSLSNDYFLPSTDCSKLKITFTSGELAGTSLAGKTITVQESKQVEANKAYTILIRLYCSDRYLYSDGTAGPLSKNPGKTPIAVVIDPYVRIAVALHDVNEGGANQLQWSNSTALTASMPVTNYRELLSGGLDNGRSWNFSGAAMTALRNYIPGFTWKCPTDYEFFYLGKAIGKMLEDGGVYKYYYYSGGNYLFLTPSGATSTGFTPIPSTINFPALDMTRFNDAFTKVGGTPPSGTYWTSTECKDGTEYKMATIEISGGKFHLGLKSKTETAKIRPFISY